MTWWDFILDTIHTILKNGITVSSAVAVLVLLLKNRKLKRYINNHLPARLRDRQEDDIAAIRRDVTAIKQHLGVEECPIVPTSAATKPCSLVTSGRFSIFSWAALFYVRFAKPFTHSNMRKSRRMNLMKKFLTKLSSRKFWGLLAALITANLVLFGIDAGTIEKVSAIVMQFGAIVVYILAEASVDKEAQKQQVYVVPGSVEPKEGVSTDAGTQSEDSAITDQPRV